MGLPRLASAIVIALLLQSAALHATNASCVFDTFTAPSGYSLSQVDGVSDDGTVVGQLMNNKTLQFMGFMRSPGGVFTEYAAPSSSVTWMYGRNGIGANAGYYQDAKNPQHIHGFMLQAGKQTAVNYPKATNTWLFDVNQLGAAVGSFNSSPSLTKGFVLVNSKYTTVAYPGSPATYAEAINDHGVVVGAYFTSVYNGFIWQNGTFTTVNHTRSKYGTVLTGINNSGVAVGNQLEADRDFGFIYQNGAFESVVYSGALYTIVGGINNNGLISGQIYLNLKDTLGYTAVCK